MKTKIQIKNRFTESIIFEYESKNNTVKETVKEFIRQELALGKSLANLSLANLSSAENKETANIPLYCKWSFFILGDLIQIGCEKRSLADWDKFFKSKEVLSTERGTEDFKQIEAVYKACKAYLTHLKK